MGIRLDQAATLRLQESTGRPSGQTAPRRPTSAQPATPQSAASGAVFAPAPAASAVPSPATSPEVSLQTAVEEINRNLQDLQTSLDIIHDEASGRSAAVVRNSDGEVIRQIPPEAVLRAIAQVHRIVGILLDETG